MCDAHDVINIEQLDLIRLREWRSAWKDAPLSAKNKQQRLVGFFHFCQSSGWITGNPAKGLSRIKCTQKPTDYFTDEEMTKIIEGTAGLKNGERLRALIELMRWSGLGNQRRLYT